MRDDRFGLNLLRMMPETVRSTMFPATPVRMPTVGARPTFASQLAMAAKDRTAAAALNKPYVSPLKQNQTRTISPNAYRPLAPRKATPASAASLASAAAAAAARARAARPVAPARPPQPVRPPAAPSPSAPLALSGYPHPDGDNGRGMHWIPTTEQSHDVVDKFVAAAQSMGVKWVTFLNDGASIGKNDYLVSKLVGAGIEPVMRLWTPTLEPIQGDIEGMVRHYVGMGVHYFQPFNEPNLNAEQPGGVAPSVDRYLNAWIPAAQAIVRGGGLPGFGSMSPGGDMNDITFLTQALDGLRARGQTDTLDHAWLSMHNYTHNHAIAERADTDGFFKFRAYHQILSNALGRDVPIIGTEGGTFVGEHEDTTQAAVTASTAVSMATQAYTYMRDQREPWNFAYSSWTIANEAGGGTDQGFSQQAMFRADGSVSPIVSALQSMTTA